MTDRTPWPFELLGTALASDSIELASAPLCVPPHDAHTYGSLQRMLRDTVAASVQELGGPMYTPHLVFMISVCRSGSTALLRLFGASGVPAGNQPLKATLRHHLVGQRYRWPWPRGVLVPVRETSRTQSAREGSEPPPKVREVGGETGRIQGRLSAPLGTGSSRPDGQQRDTLGVGAHGDESKRVMFVKSTLGPFTQSECLFDPISALVDGGYPESRIRLLVLGREPLCTYSSWKEHWGPRLGAALIEHFVLASLNLRRLESAALRRGMRCHWFTYAQLASPTCAVPGLFAELEMDSFYHPQITHGWAPLQSPQSGVVSAPEPAFFRTDGLHIDIDCLRHRRRLPLLPQDDVSRLEQAGILSDHERRVRLSRLCLPSH